MSHAKTNDNTPISIANMEQNITDASKRKDEVAEINSRVNIHIHSVRHRLADIDGISAKAAIDGLVHAKILKDDSAKEVKEVTYSQEKTKGQEETIITIEVI